MYDNKSSVNPVLDNNNFLIGTVVVMVAVESDFKFVNKFILDACINKRKIYISWIYTYKTVEGYIYSIVGPFIGSPYAAMILEFLKICGVRQIIFFGWCGAISENIYINDVIIPDAVIVDEGTSRHYSIYYGSKIWCSLDIREKIIKFFQKKNIFFYDGYIWTTDAIFRETKNKVDYFKSRGIIGVEMELSVILSVAMFYKIKSAAILIVSDKIGNDKWHFGFKMKLFKKVRCCLYAMISSVCRGLI